MTTIAYRDGVLAADSRAIRGDSFNDHMVANKLHRLRDGSIAAFCGDHAAGLRFVEEWNAEGKIVTPINSGSGIIHVQPDGRAFIYESGGRLHINTPFYASGSGYQIATVAMDLGKSAIEAVRLAAKYDVYTGGRIRSLSISR